MKLNQFNPKWKNNPWLCFLALIKEETITSNPRAYRLMKLFYANITLFHINLFNEAHVIVYDTDKNIRIVHKSNFMTEGYKYYTLIP